jgi:hypothetical protein
MTEDEEELALPPEGKPFSWSGVKEKIPGAPAPEVEKEERIWRNPPPQEQNPRFGPSLFSPSRHRQR